MRIARLHSWGSAWFVWNLLLARVPHAASLATAGRRRGRPGRPRLLSLPGLAWLAFLPNAPYLVTDFMHIFPRPDLPWPY